MWLYHKLHSADLTVWYDENEILVGDSITARMLEGLEGSALVILVLSEAAIASRWLQEELAPEVLRHLYQPEAAILPVIVGELAAELLPAVLRGRRLIRFPPQGSDEQFRELLADIEQHLMRRGLLRVPQMGAVGATAPLLHNPFGLRGGVEPARFVVPTRLVREVTEDIVKKQSISVVGARMMGKTSLLKFLISDRCRSYYRDERGRQQQLRFVYVDLQEHAGKDRDDLLPLLARSMSDLLPEGKRFAGSTHAAALEWMKDTAGRSHRGRARWILVFDEFDRVVELSNLDATLFDELRSLPQHYNLDFVIASRRKLIDLPLPRNITTSPFFNLFKEVFLSVWDAATMRALMFRPRGRPLELFRAEDVALMTQLTARHPLLLQIGCYHLFNIRRADGAEGDDSDTEADALAQFYYHYMQEAESVYRYYWQYEIDEQEQAWLRECWQATVKEEAETLIALQHNTPQRKNSTIRVKLAKLGLVQGQRGPITLPRGVQFFLVNGSSFS
jgi:hypothetical protein